MYTLFVLYRDETLIELPYTSCSYNEEQNKGKDARFVLDYRAVKDIADIYNTTVDFIITGGYREIYIEKSGTKIYYGVISDYALGKDESGNLSIQIASIDFFSLLAKRIVGAKRTFTAEEASVIAWTLIDESQSSEVNADLGITQGAVTTSKNRDKTFRFDTIKEAIEYISNFNLKDGFDFDIDNSKRFNCYYPQKGSNRANIVLDENILSWSWRKPLVMTLTNKAYVVGQGFNDEVEYVVRESDTTYKEAFTVLEEVLTETDIQTTTTLNDKGDRHLSQYQAPVPELTLTLSDDDPDILDYEVGDSVYVVIPEVGLNKTYKRIYKRSVAISTNQLAIVSLSLR